MQYYEQNSTSKVQLVGLSIHRELHAAGLVLLVLGLNVITVDRALCLCACLLK